MRTSKTRRRVERKQAKKVATQTAKTHINAAHINTYGHWASETADTIRGH